MCIIHIYQCGGFTIQTLLMDSGFESVKEKMPYNIASTTTANDHVGDIKAKHLSSRNDAVVP